MKRLTVFGLIISLGVLALAAVAFAGRSHDRGDGKHFSARLNGWEEDPSQVTTGKGSFSADIVSATEIKFTLKYEDLEGPAFMAHIHIGSRHESGGISAWLCGGTTQPACAPGPDGTVTGSILAEDITGPAGQGVEPGNFVDLIRAVRKGETYTNVHTGSAGPPPSGRAPGGEIRGQNHVDKRGHDDHHKGKGKRH